MLLLRNIPVVVFVILVAGCTQQGEQNIPHTDTPVFKRVNITYQLISPKDSIKKVIGRLDSLQKKIVLAVNRVDLPNLASLDTLVIPANLDEHIFQYQPYAADVPYLKDIHKIIFFSYPSQFFGAYENGRLVYAGPTSMGRKKDKTPTGLFYANWKAEETISTFNDEWELKWNFNIENDSGIGWHQYAMPGYPASHSCLRLTENDAQYLYQWADEWMLKGTDSVLAKGTPVIVFGSYPFGGSKPWFGLSQNPKALDISAKDLENLVVPYLADILARQAERAKVKQ